MGDRYQRCIINSRVDLTDDVVGVVIYVQYADLCFNKTFLYIFFFQVKIKRIKALGKTDCKCHFQICFAIIVISMVHMK